MRFFSVFWNDYAVHRSAVRQVLNGEDRENEVHFDIIGLRAGYKGQLKFIIDLRSTNSFHLQTNKQPSHTIMSSIVLGPGPEIPPLTAFVQLGLTAIYEAASLDDFNSAFDSVFAKSLTDITFNGETLTRDQYKSKLRSQQPLATPASSVTFGGVVTDSTDNVRGRSF